MSAVERALWFIESRFAGPVSLGEVAAASGVSPFHLARLFALATGMPVIAYARARRLSESARALAAGRPDILGLALDCGYGSHEAFTRAFRDHFGVTPEAARACGARNLQLTEPYPVTDIVKIALSEPRMLTRPAFAVAGLAARIGSDQVSAIPSLWQRFGPYFGHVPGQVGGDAYGVCHDMDAEGRFEYLAGVEVGSGHDLLPQFSRVRLPAAGYAVFRHDDHVSTLRHTFAAIYEQWLPASGRRAEGPDFERYGPEFDPMTGRGGIEVWIALAP